MTDTLDIRIKPFTIRHRRLLSDWNLEGLPERAKQRLWSTLEAFNESFEDYHPDNPGYTWHASDLTRCRALYARLLGIPEDSDEDNLHYQVINGQTKTCFDILECFCAWLDAAGDRMPKVQRAINDTFDDYHLPWRMAEGRIFQVDDAYLEDEILADVTPLLGLAEFHGAHDEFMRARDYLTDGNARDAIGYANASVESALKTVLGGCAKTGKELVQEYANKDLMNLPLPKAQEVQKALTAVTTLRNALAWHGQGPSVLPIPHEYGVLAVGLAAVINTFVTRQHLARQNKEPPKKLPAKSAVPAVAEPEWDDSDIPF